MKTEEKINNRISKLENEKSEVLSEYSNAKYDMLDVLAERNTRISFELKFLNELLSSPPLEVKAEESAEQMATKIIQMVASNFNCNTGNMSNYQGIHSFITSQFKGGKNEEMSEQEKNIHYCKGFEVATMKYEKAGLLLTHPIKQVSATEEDRITFIIDGKQESESYSIMELADICEEKIFEDAENKYHTPCTNESTMHCECNPLFDDSKITGFTSSPSSQEQVEKEVELLEWIGYNGWRAIPLTKKWTIDTSEIVSTSELLTLFRQSLGR